MKKAKKKAIREKGNGLIPVILLKFYLIIDIF